MTKQAEAMKAALTALKSIDEAMPFPVAKFAIRQLEEALAEQPAQVDPCIDGYNMEVAFLAGKQSVANSDIFKERVDETQKQRHDATPPASKPWIGLTNEDKAEIEKIVGITEDDDGWMVSQMFTLAEAKLREKNT